MKKLIICLVLLFSISASAQELELVNANTVRIAWIAVCYNSLVGTTYELKSAPIPWHRQGIQFTTISGQKVIVTSGSSCVFRQVPK